MCVSAVIFIGCIIGGWLYYTASRTANDYHDITDRMQERAGKIESIIKVSLETLKVQIKAMEHKQVVLRRQRDVWAAIAALSLGGVIARQ
mgnify:CR=1 FL=1